MRSRVMQATECPLVSSLSISSKRRAAGTFSIRRASRGIGSRVASSISNPSLAQSAPLAACGPGLAVAGLRIADHAQPLVAQILDAVVIIDDFARGGVVVERIYAEVPPRGVLVLFTEQVVASTRPCSSVCRSGFSSARKVETSIVFLPEHHMHQAEAPPDDDGAAEVRLDLFRRGIGCHVEVLGATPSSRSRTAPPTR